jgi:hypothetical protein
MTNEWESMSTDDLFELHEQMVVVLRARLLARKAALERRMHVLSQQAKALESVKPGLPG